MEATGLGVLVADFLGRGFGGAFDFGWVQTSPGLKLARGDTAKF